MYEVSTEGLSGTRCTNATAPAITACSVLSANSRGLAYSTEGTSVPLPPMLTQAGYWLACCTVPRRDQTLWRVGQRNVSVTFAYLIVTNSSAEVG